MSGFDKKPKKGQLDLRYGNPVFLQRICSELDINYRITSTLHGAIVDEIHDANRGYMESETWHQIVSKIRYLHKVSGFFKGYDLENETLIVGAGATQIINAAIYAFKAQKKKKHSLYVPAPYFPRFKDFAGLAGIKLTHNQAGSTISMITAPNNPDGWVPQTPLKKHVDILDMCYHWPSYLEKPLDSQMADGTVKVFSLSKLTGHASARFGWAFVKDPEIAALMKHYIEISSSGVSFQTQEAVSRLLDDLIHMQDGQSALKINSLFRSAKNELDYRRFLLKNLMKIHKNIKILDQRGMFLLLKAENGFDLIDFLDKRDIAYVRGEYFGLDKEHARLNLGCSGLDINDLLRRLTGND